MEATFDLLGDVRPPWIAGCATWGSRSRPRPARQRGRRSTKTSGWPGTDRSSSTTIRPPRPRRHRACVGDRVGPHPGRPHRRVGGDDVPSEGGTPVGVDPLDADPEPHVDAPPFEGAQGARCDDAAVNGVSNRSATSTSDDACVPHGQRWEVAPAARACRAPSSPRPSPRRSGHRRRPRRSEATRRRAPARLSPARSRRARGCGCRVHRRAT